jgi:hypothetical protein
MFDENNVNRGAPDERVRAVIGDFREAAKIVSRALGKLNNRSKQCNDCGHKEYEDFFEANAVQALSGTAEKLDRWADALETPADYTARGVLKEVAAANRDVRRRGTNRQRGG